MDWTILLTIGHILGAVLGVGGATASDLLFLRSIRDRKVSKDEFALLETLSHIIMAGMALLFISGVGFLTMHYVNSGRLDLLHEARFQMKFLGVIIVFVNAFSFHKLIFPLMNKYVGRSLANTEVREKLWVMATTGAISIVTWYTVFFLGLLRGLQLPFLFLFNTYLLVLAGGMLFGYLTISHMLFGEKVPKVRQKKVSSRSVSRPSFGRSLSVLLVVFALGAVAWAVPSFSQGETHIVCIRETPPWFFPEVLEIQKGDTVIWTHCAEEVGHHEGHGGHHGNVLPDGAVTSKVLQPFIREASAHADHHHPDHMNMHIHTHPILALSGPELFSSGSGPVGHMEDGNGFSHRFTKKGIYEYICPTHPYMKGVIAVGVAPEKDSLWPPKEEIKPSLLPTPSVPGMGEIWVNTQFERVPGQTFPGTITVIDAETWEIKEVISDETFNNPHNLWAFRDGRYVFQTQWHSDAFSKIDTETKEVVGTAHLGNAPAHVFTHPHRDRIYVTVNNENRVVVLDTDLNIVGEIEVSFGPHGIWVDPSGKWMTIAATLSEKLDIIDLDREEVVATFDAPGLPLATAITHDGKYAMVSLLLEGAVRFIDLETLEHVADVPVGTMPIWPSPGPNGEYVFVPNTGSADISVISLETLEVVKTLPAASGAHGIIFGQKEGGGYYGYFSNKFARAVGVIDAETLETVGYIPLGDAAWGGNGILTIPNSYHEHIR